MESNIRPMTAQDKACVYEMMRTFYSSPAVFTDGSDEIFLNDIDGCIHNPQYLEGYIIESGDEVQGYAMIAKSFSTEFGKPCIWIEDIYFKESCRGLGLGKQFFDFITKKHTNCIFRLEVEKENTRALALYEKCGFTTLPYMEMIKFLR